MSFNLIIGDQVPTWDEFGGYVHERYIDIPWRVHGTNMVIDPLTGFLSLPPAYGPWVYDSDSDSYTNYFLNPATAGYFVDRTIYEDKNCTAVYFKEMEAFTATRGASYWLKRYEGFNTFFEVVPYAGGVNDQFNIEIYHQWKFLFKEGLSAELQKYDPGTASWITQDYFDPPLETLFTKNRLLIYQAGNYLVLKNWADLGGGYKWLEKNPVYTREEEDGPQLPTLIDAGPVVYSGLGRTYFAFRHLYWGVERTTISYTTSSGSVTRDNVNLMRPSTAYSMQTTESTDYKESHHYEGWLTNRTSIDMTLYDQNGDEWDDPDLGDATTWPTAFSWGLAVNQTTESYQDGITSFLGKAHVVIPANLKLSPDVSVELMASDPGPTEVVLTEDLDPGNHVLRATVVDSSTLATYLEPAQRLDFKVDGTTLFTGLVVDPEDEYGGGWSDLEHLAVMAKADRRLTVGSLFNVPAADGANLSTVLLGAFTAAAIDPANVTIPAFDFTFPYPDPDEEPRFVPDPGGTPGEYIDYLLETGAPDYTWRALPNFVYEVVPRDTGGASVATFYTTVAAAATAGYPTRYMHRCRAKYTDEGYCNILVVVGERKDGVPLIAYWINFTDLETRPPYLPIITLILDRNLRDQETVNWVCRRSSERVSVKRLMIEFDAGFVATAIPGTIITVGANTFRIISRTTTWSAHKEPAGWTNYQAERVW